MFQNEKPYTVTVAVNGQNKPPMIVHATNGDNAAAKAAQWACYTRPGEKPPTSVRVVSVTLAI